MISKIKNSLSSRVAMYIIAILIPIILRIAFEYYEQRSSFGVTQIAVVSGIILGIVAITIFFYSNYEFAARWWLMPDNSVKRCVVCSLAIIVVAISGYIYVTEENIYFLMNTRNYSDAPLFVSCTLFPVAITFWVDAIRKSESNSSKIIGVVITFMMSLTEIFIFHENRNAVLEMAIIINTAVVYTAGRICSENKHRWNESILAGLFFVVNNAFLIVIKGVFTLDKIVNISFYERYKEWNHTLLENARLLGNAQLPVLDINEAEIWDVKNLFHAMLYENGYLIAGIYLMLLLLLLLILTRMIALGYKRMSCLPGVACTGYLILKTVLAILFSIGISPIPMHLIFARGSFLDVIALGVIIHCFYVVHKADKYAREIEEEKLQYTDELFGAEGKLKVVERNRMDDMLLTLTILNENNMKKYDFMMANECVEYREERYSVLASFDNLDFLVILKNMDDEEYPYGLVEESIQLEVFKKYQKEMGEMYV